MNLSTIVTGDEKEALVDEAALTPSASEENDKTNTNKLLFEDYNSLPVPDILAINGCSPQT